MKFDIIGLIAALLPKTTKGRMTLYICLTLLLMCLIFAAAYTGVFDDAVLHLIPGDA